MLYKKEDATKGKFAFTTDDYDMYKVCVESEGKNRGKPLAIVLCYNTGTLVKLALVEIIRQGFHVALGLLCIWFLSCYSLYKSVLS